MHGVATSPVIGSRGSALMCAPSSCAFLAFYVTCDEAERDRHDIRTRDMKSRMTGFECMIRRICGHPGARIAFRPPTRSSVTATRRAVSVQARFTNYTNQMNPAHIAYWNARGWNGIPDDWYDRYQNEKASQANNKLNRARQLNPACTEYWTSRGYKSAPWRLVVFRASSLGKYAQGWPLLLDGVEREGLGYLNRLGHHT